MSIQTLKKKAVINNISKRSGKSPGGVWITQGPFGRNNINSASPSPSIVGFSINGGTRNVGYIGKSSAFSKQGTPFTGQFAKGYGGCSGNYSNPQSVMNSPIIRCYTQGSQAEYIKPSVLSSKGMIKKRYKWINGQYPNYWVQPQSSNDNMANNSSQLVYIQKKAVENDCVIDTNKPEIYIGNCINNNNNCNNSNNFINSTRGYTKTLYQPQTSSQHTLRIQRQCVNPIGKLKPFPFSVNNNNNSSKGSYAPPAIHTIYYNTPPDWYWDINN